VTGTGPVILIRIAPEDTWRQLRTLKPKFAFIYRGVIYISHFAHFSFVVYAIWQAALRMPKRKSKCPQTSDFWLTSAGACLYLYLYLYLLPVSCGYRNPLMPAWPAGEGERKCANLYASSINRGVIRQRCIAASHSRAQSHWVSTWPRGAGIT